MSDIMRPPFNREVSVKAHLRVRSFCFVGVLCAAIGVSFVHAQNEQEPLWAYGFATPPKPGDKAAPQAPPTRNLRPNEDPAEQTRPQHVEGSSGTYTLVDIRDGHNVIDWFPGDHPPMPDVVKNGPASLMDQRGRGCGSCHLPNGKGRPENAPPAGQPAAYTLRQLHDFRNGLRMSADRRKPNTATMVGLALAMSEKEMQEAADYYAAMRWTPWIEVIETDLVPELELETGNMYIVKGKERTVPIAGRIIETPRDEHQANVLRNPRSGWIAYVPAGSLAKGEKLVTTGGVAVVNGKIAPGKTVACGTCHGPDLMGLADVPGIAGRSPSYMMRQLWDMKLGTRKGLSAQLMKQVVANLTVDDMTAVVAYLASIKVPPPAGQSASVR
jgi:cytochrome c553